MKQLFGYKQVSELTGRRVHAYSNGMRGVFLSKNIYFFISFSFPIFSLFIFLQPWTVVVEGQSLLGKCRRGQESPQPDLVRLTFAQATIGFSTSPECQPRQIWRGGPSLALALAQASHHLSALTRHCLGKDNAKRDHCGLGEDRPHQIQRGSLSLALTRPASPIIACSVGVGRPLPGLVGPRWSLLGLSLSSGHQQVIGGLRPLFGIN